MGCTTKGHSVRRSNTQSIERIRFHEDATVTFWLKQRIRDRWKSLSVRGRYFLNGQYVELFLGDDVYRAEYEIMGPELIRFHYHFIDGFFMKDTERDEGQ